MFQFWQMAKKIFSFGAKIQIHVSVLTKDKNIEFWHENSIISYNIDKWQKYTMFVLNFGAKIQMFISILSIRILTNDKNMEFLYSILARKFKYLIPIWSIRILTNDKNMEFL